MLFVVAAHIAYRVQRVDDPEAGRERCEQHAERLHAERDLYARQQFRNGHTGPAARHNDRQQAPYRDGEPGCGYERDRLTQIRADPTGKRNADSAGKRQR